MKWVLILLVAGAVVALPFIFQRPQEAGEWKPGDPELIVVTPHNEAIRHEFARGFSRWHQRRYHKPVLLDWRVIGGTTEIMRYLASEYKASTEHYIKEKARNGETVAPAAARTLDDPKAVSCGIDLFFGGGAFDHERAEKQGLTVPAWKGDPPDGLFAADGVVLIPESAGGETWRGRAFYGSVLSTFGICYNTDRLADLGVAKPPASWEDLADPRLVGRVGLADPTKSGSVAKAFEMMIHSAIAKRVAAAGFSRQDIETFEARLADAASPGPEGAAAVPEAYQKAVSAGWLEGLRLVRRIGANARYFTDSSGKVPVDVASGAAAAGIAIDFFGRLQAEESAVRDGRHVMGYVTPIGESSVSADPVSLLRGAPHRELAVRFIEYVLSEDGQKLWDYRVGTEGGPDRFALRRLPIRRTFYPSASPAAGFESHRPNLSDPLWESSCNAYHLADAFLYVPRWTGRHFDIQRDLVRAMCMDSGDELRAAWQAILAHGGPEKNPEAMRLLESFPDEPPLTWENALAVYSKMPRLERLRVLTAFFRRQYDAARKAVKEHP